MNNKIKKYSMLLLALVMIVVTAITFKVNAAEPTTGSLTIICYEQNDGQDTSVPIEGVEYRLVKVENDATLEDAKKYIGTSNYKATTDENGRVVFNDLAEGRYFAYTYGKTIIHKDSTFNEYLEHEDFLIDIPMTNNDGNGLVYDVVAEPKVKKKYGNLEITKTDMLGNVIEGVEFEVIPSFILINKENGSIENVQTGNTSDMILTTNKDGKISLENIPYIIPRDGKSPNQNECYYYPGYRIAEKSNPKDGMITSSNAARGINIFVWVDESGTVKTNYTEGFEYGTALRGGSRFLVSLTEAENLTSIKIMNEKVNIEKKVKNSFGEYVDSISANLKDTITFRIITDVPNIVTGLKTYTISDNLPEGFTLDKESIIIQGATADGFETIPEDIYTLSEDGLEIVFSTNNMGQDIGEYKSSPKYNSIIVTYDVNLNENNMIIGENGNINTATLKYTNNMGFLQEISQYTISDTAEVHTGAVKIEKTDKLDETKKLAGAKFKVATSESNAKAGTFVTDENNADIEVTTDSQGQAMIKGLAYADNGSDVSYWLVETEAPKYEETVDGVETEKSYNLLKNPVEVKVGKITHNTAVQIKNSKGLNLPLTGGIGIAIFAIAGISVMIVAIVLNKKKEIIEK